MPGHNPTGNHPAPPARRRVKPGVNKEKAQYELEKNLREVTFLGINVMPFDPGTLPRQQGKAVRYEDIRDRPEGYKGWLKMINGKK